MDGRAPRWPDGEGRHEGPVGLAGAGEAMHAVSRLLGTAADAGCPSVVADTLVAEARRFFRVSRALLASVAEPEGRLEVVAVSPAGEARDGSIAVTELGPLAQLLHSGEPDLRVAGPEAAAV